MTQQPRFAGVKGDECQCGRRATVRHCPRCGSTRLYAYSTPQYHEMLSGERKLVEHLIRCLSCAHKFEESDREFCEAPPFGPTLAAQKVRALREASQTGEYLNPNDKEAADAINELVAKAPQAPQELSDSELGKMDFQLRNVWVDKRLAAKQNGQKFDETVYDFVIRMLKEHGYNEAVIQRVKERHERDRKQSNTSTTAS